MAESPATDLKFDVDLMSQAANYINDAFTTLSDSIEYVNNEFFDSYISGTDGEGTAIRTPKFGRNLNDTWHKSVDVGLKDFITHFNDWSAVMALVSQTGANYTNEALATYGENIGEIAASIDGTLAGSIANLGPLLSVPEQQHVRDVLNINTVYDDASWAEAISGLNERERAAVTAENQKTADSQYYMYKHYMEMDPSDSSYNVMKGVIEHKNPEVRAMFEQRYSNEQTQ